MIFESDFNTPLGKMTCLSSDSGLHLLEFVSRAKSEISKEKKEVAAALQADIAKGENDIVRKLKVQMAEYFEGKRQKFSIPLKLIGTEFQLKVWSELMLVPYGETRSYLEHAESLGDVKAIRAVASANGRNKIAILVPCHRIIGSDGSLTGYAGGIEKKRFLLNLEREVAGPKDLFSV